MPVALFATAYFPTVEYFLSLMRFDAITIEAHEHFLKQTNRSRSHILSPNGIQTLSIPLVQTHRKIFTKDVEVDLNSNWKQQHWRSITTAYNRSAFFEFYSDKIKETFFSDEKNLLHFNTKLTNCIIKLFKQKTEINFTTSFQKKVENDFRFISDKKNTSTATEIAFKKYPQVFSTKFEFQKNLSVLDLLFNCGNRIDV